MPDRPELLNFALQLARIAEDQIMPHYQNAAVDYKADGSEVTVADRGAEEAIRAAIAERYPDHGVLGEEFGESNPSARQQWIIDPVDGTAWFTLGMPLFGTLIAYVEDHEPIIGVIHFPALQETVYAARGHGCWFKARHRVPVRIHVQNGVALADAYVSASGVHNSDVTGDDAVDNLSAVIRSARKFRFCGDCGQYTLVCRGKIHAALDTVVNPWDIAALVPCVEEAGGVISSLSADRQNVLYGGNVLASSDPALHAEILKCLRPG